MKTFSLFLTAVLVFGGAVPAFAGKKKHRHGHRHHHHHYHRPYYRPYYRPAPYVNFYASPYSYWGPPTVIYSQPRTVYVDRPVYVEEPVIQGRAVVAGSVERDVQAALARQRYYGGVIDGKIGPQTRAAIRAYQVDKNLPVTGRIDGNLLRSLRLL